MGNIFDDINDVDSSLEVMTEAVYPESIQYMKTLNKQMYLPQGNPIGKGNLCFIYSYNLNDSIRVMTDKKNFNNKKHYKYYFYNMMYVGKLYNRNYRLRDFDIRKEYYQKVEDLTDLQTIINLNNIANNNRNMFYETFRYLEIFDNICAKLPIMKYIELYWSFMNKVYHTQIKGYNNRFVLVNLDLFTMDDKADLKENLKNPLYMIYYTTFRYPEYLKGVDIDFYFYTGKKILKINPTMCNKETYATLRAEMTRIMKGTVSDTKLDNIMNAGEISVKEVEADTVAKVTDVLAPVASGEMIQTTEELKKLAVKTTVEKDIDKKVKTKTKEEITDDKTEVNSEVVSKAVSDEIDKDREMIEKIYYQSKNSQPKKSEASTARDKLIRKEQENIAVGNMTIAEIKKIKSNDILVPERDVSRVVKSTNENIKKVRFANMDKEYNKKLMKKDIVNSFLALNDKSIPMFIIDVNVDDTSDELNYKETYTVTLEDTNRKRHVIKVDIPKFIDDKFVYIGGNKKVIKYQNYFFPVVKIAPNMVQIVTNYNKMTVERVENRSISSVERLKKIISKHEELKEFFTMGNVFSNNLNHLTTLEYDDLSKIISSFKYEKTNIMFDQSVAKSYMEEHGIHNEDERKIFIGIVNGENCFIDCDTQEDEKGRTITDIILDTLPDEFSASYAKTKTPKRLMYTRVKVMEQFVSVGMLLGFWCGLSNVLKSLKLEYRLEDKVPSHLEANEEFLKFEDCVMVYKDTIPTALIMNGFKLFDTTKYPLVSFDEKEPYIDYIKKIYGSAIIENALMNTYEFGVDPITLEICKNLNLPDNLLDLFVYAVNLLSDSQYIVDINQNLSRIRNNEIIPAILYERLAKNYVTYRNSNGRKKFSVPRDSVIKEILALKTVEDYSTLNPTLEMETLHSVSAKGFRGVNLDEAYTVPKRSYDPSMIGIISPGTPPDGNVGINKTLTLEPNITNLRGYTLDKHENMKELKDVNLFSPGELSIPLGATIDDPSRLGHAIKQSKHVIPVKSSAPVLISNGMEEVARFHLTSNFVINAEEDGEIVDYDEETKVMIARYKSGKCRAIDLSPKIVKNGGGGFFLSNILVPKYKVGDKFKRDDVLAYHKDFFKDDEFNNCRMVMGTLAKVAIMSTYNTYEDGTFITHKFAEDASTEMVFCKSAVIGKNSNVFYMVEKGQEVSVGDALIRFDTSYEDETINTLLANLGEKEKESILEGARNEIKCKYSGTIEDIKIYPTIDLEEMSPSLRKIVNRYYKGINKKKAFLEKYDEESKNSIVKCGILCDEVSHAIEPNKFGVIRGEHVEDSVLIEFYIKHAEPLEIGSKIANFTALKNTIGEIIPEGYEPYSDYRKDEEVSTFIASNSILNRMTPSILLTALGNKCIIELKRHLEELNFDREKMEKLIYRFFSAFDKTGKNTKKYKALFEPMSDTKFKQYFKKLFENENAYLILDIVDYERSIGIDDISDAAKVLGVPLYEYVYTPHLTMDKEQVICTKEPVPVGYINIKRTQQTVMKKNGISTEIADRSALTNQVSGKDKNGRESDMENTMLTIMGMHNTIKELNAPRADDGHMKQQMLRDIATNGYTRLADMEDLIENKTTLNTVDVYFLGMGIKTDLVTRGLMVNKTLKEEL